MPSNLNYSRIVILAASLVLTFAAVMKFYMLITDPFADLRTGVHKYLLICITLWEAIVVSMVWCRAGRALERRLLVTTYSVFAASSAYRWWSGVNACGCFGAIYVPIGASFGLCVFFAFLLTFVRVAPIPGDYSDGSKVIGIGRHRSAAVGSVIGILLFGISLVLLDAFLLSPTGRWIGAVSSLQRMVVGEPTNVDVTIANRSADPARVVGMRSSCNCAMPDKGLREIGPHESVTTSVVVVPRTEGQFHQRVVVYVDHPNQSIVSVDLKGVVSK